MTIVCGTDFSQYAADATAIAAAIARRRAEKLLLVHVVETEPGDPVAGYSETLRARCAADLDKLAAELRASGAGVETKTVMGTPHGELIAHAPPDTTLFVVGGRGHTLGSHWLIGSVAERLARTSPHPLLVVRHAEAMHHWLSGIRRLSVLVATDLTPASDYALERASMLRELGPCDVELTYIEYPPFEYARLGIDGPIHRRPNPFIEEIIEGELRKRAARTKLGDDVRTHVVSTFGRTAKRIADLAETEHADLIVVGTHQREGFARLWHESIAHGVLHAAGANVLCVPFHDAGEERRALELPRLERILAATDFSPCGNRAVAWAMATARSGARVAIVHVAPEGERAEAEAKLRELRSDTWPRDIEVETEVLDGRNPAVAIAAAAERAAADLIVIGRRGHSRLPFLLGSTAEELLVRSNRPVLVARDEAS